MQNAAGAPLNTVGAGLNLAGQYGGIIGGPTVLSQSSGNASNNSLGTNFSNSMNAGVNNSQGMNFSDSYGASNANSTSKGKGSGKGFNVQGAS